MPTFEQYTIDKQVGIGHFGGVSSPLFIAAITEAYLLFFAWAHSRDQNADLVTFVAFAGIGESGSDVTIVSVVAPG